MTCLAAAPSAFALGPTNTSRPTISGTVQAGNTLQGQPGSWDSLAPPVTYSYSWCRISGSSCTFLASGQTYHLSAPVIGQRIKLVVTASDTFGSNQKDSTPTAPVAQNPPDNSAPPTFSGTAREGQRLTRASLGSWGNPTPTSYARQWLRCNSSGGACAAISGATDDIYGVVAADVGHRLRLRVTAAGPYGSAQALSGGSALVTKRPAPKPKRARRLSPFPRILVTGALSPSGAVFRRVLVKGPRNVTVRVRCRGRGCPYRAHSYRMRRRKLRLRSLERNFGPGAVIELRVLKRGRIGKYTRMRIRRGRVPSRVDRCLNPGSPRPRRCAR